MGQLRDMKKEFQPGFGVTSVNATTGMDFYYGVFSNQTEAFKEVPEGMRLVGKPIAIYTDETEQNSNFYLWAKNSSGWFLQSLTGETGTYVQAIGGVEATRDIVTVTTPISVYFNYQKYTKDERVDLPFTPVSSSNVKVLVVYALPTSQLIYLAEGAEGVEVTEPEIPDGALFIRRALVTNQGAVFDPEVDLVAYKKKIEDNWLVVPFVSDSTPIKLQMVDDRSNFYMTGGAGTGNAVIASITLIGIVDRDIDIKIYNAGSKPITINANATFKSQKGFSANGTPLTILPFREAKLKYNKDLNIIEVMRVAGADSQNITNSSNTTTGSYTQTQRVGDTWDWNTNGQPYNLKNLPDKRADISFNRMMGFDANGQLAEVGYNALMRASANWTAQQYLDYAQLLNGGLGSSGPMSVNLISPPLIQNGFNSNEYILLMGANLNLSTGGRKIEILASDKTTVIATIPDGNIQVYADGLSLIFYYNFYNFPLGNYFLRITSGVKVYITTLDLKIIQNIVNIPLEKVNWEIIYATPSDNLGNNVLQGRNVNIRTPVGSASPSPVIAFKSDELFAQGDDFYIEIKVSASIETNNSEASSEVNKSFFGLGYSNSTNALVNNSLIYYAYQFTNIFISGNPNRFHVTEYNNTVLAKHTPSILGASDTTVIFIKTGNLFRTIIEGTNTSTTLSNNSGYSLYGALVARVKERSFNVQIIKAFKFN